MNKTVGSSLNEKWFIPGSFDDMKNIYSSDLKNLMEQDIYYFNAIVDQCSEIVELLIGDCKLDYRFRKACKARKVKTLDDLLSSGYFHKDYEASRIEFIDLFVECYLYDEDYWS